MGAAPPLPGFDHHGVVMPTRVRIPRGRDAFPSERVNSYAYTRDAALQSGLPAC